MNHADSLPVALQKAIACRCGLERTINSIRRRSSPYRTSFPLDEVDVVLDNDTTVGFVLKNVSRGSLAEAIRAAKPAFLDHPQREIKTYQTILPFAPAGPPACYGMVADPETGSAWLLLERVEGQRLDWVGDIETWNAVARWLARFHQAFAHQSAPDQPLLIYDADYYRVWLQRAIAFTTGSARQWLTWLASRYEPIVERLLALPQTILHGEFYASNILVQGTRVCAIDWETTAWGPGLIDLAALTSGKWNESERTVLARAYHEIISASGPSNEREFFKALDWCRLHQAVRWIGWSGDWRPPAEAAQDWIGEARTIAERIGL